MNPIINAASANSELGWLMGLTTVLFVATFAFWTWWAYASKHKARWLMGITTVLFVATFAFWTWWAYASKHKARWEADSRLPLNDGGDS